MRGRALAKTVPLSLDKFESRLLGRKAQEISASRRAAVAALLRFEDKASPEVLLMRRAEGEHDRWSGQVCFPGGMFEESDPDLHATAVRETQEELGIELGQCSRFLGPMDAIPATARGRILSTSISPFVFLETTPAEIRLGHEAAHSFWLPLRQARRGDFNSSFDYDAGDHTIAFPCWRFEGEVIWGLTFKMLETLLELVGSSHG